MSVAPKNLFIVGDLVIDHTIFVQDISADRSSIPQPAFDTIRRLDTAGGAANCARIMGVLNPGNTFLWGLIGQSHWGDFRRILEHCQAIDGARCNIKFRGAHDETQAQMNTITRVIKEESIPSGYGSPTALFRFDDYGHVHVSDDKRRTALHYVKRIPTKYHALDAIVLNDLDMGCLTNQLISNLAKFANSEGVMLFVNPKYKRNKYLNIQGTAMISSFPEWCHLVGEASFSIDRESSLKHMAQLSFQYFGGFIFHIIECAEAGLVLIAPHPDMEDKYAVYRLQPHTTKKNVPRPQLGCIDILTAVFALEFASSDASTGAAIDALQKANAALACYRDMPWHRMPSREAVSDEQQEMNQPKLSAAPSKGMLFLPKQSIIRLSDPKVETRIPGLYSVDSTFRERIDALVEDIASGIRRADPKSIILTAPSGTGKSTILNELAGTIGERLHVQLIVIKKVESIGSDFDEYFEGLVKNMSSKADKIVLAIDEAMKSPMAQYLKDYGVNLLDSAHAHKIRFLLIDADFGGNQVAVDSQVTSRCLMYHLPALRQRPIDIPYIVAGMFFDRAKAEGLVLTAIKCDSKFLLSFVNKTLSHPHPRDLRSWIGDAYKAALADRQTGDTLEFTYKHLPKTINPSGKEPSDILTGPPFYEFYKRV